MTHQFVQDTRAESWPTLMVTALSDKTTGTRCNNKHTGCPGGKEDNPHCLCSDKRLPLTKKILEALWTIFKNDSKNQHGTKCTGLQEICGLKKGRHKTAKIHKEASLHHGGVLEN